MDQNKTQSGEATEEEQREKKEQENGKNNTLKEKENKVKEATEKEQMKEKRQEKGKASAMKEKESKEKETTGKEQKKQKREKAEKELKKKPSLLSLFGLEKDAPTVKENIERKKREREKLRVENKEAASPKKKTKEHTTETTVLKWGHRFYGEFVIYKKCPEMDEIIGRTRKTSWVEMGTEIEASALVHEDSVQGFMEAAKRYMVDHWKCRLKECPSHVERYDTLVHEIEYI
ncbi:Hypothetical predicted protein [Octopus vulgaris]|uniref:Uncharacterized protein n=1 Tax=Octopus vulgaris TaxID=6645 RepID=A0AA36F4K1_OCTVU|nr:Hypothetical predicted protein [Octopus vulgaris]